MLCVVFGLSLLDRTNISAAYIAGLAEDLHLAVGARYNIALLIFFVRTFHDFGVSRDVLNVPSIRALRNPIKRCN